MTPDVHKRKQWWLLLTAFALLVSLGLTTVALRAGGPAGAAAAPVAPGVTKHLGNGVTYGTDLKHDVSPPLRSIPPITGLSLHYEAPENPMPPLRPLQSLKDTVVQRTFGALAMPTPSVSFDGVSEVSGGCGCQPPDTNGDVGPNNYVQTVNVAFQIWDKQGQSLYGPAHINTLFQGFGGACETHNDGDPEVLYDPLADRWLFEQFTSSPPYEQCVAVSQTADPTGAYYRYAFQLSATVFYDYPKMGVWPDGYYLTGNGFVGNGYSNPVFAAFDRAKMLQGQAATFQSVNPGNFYSDLLPADMDGHAPPPTGAPEPFLTVADNNTVANLWRFHVDWNTPNNSALLGPFQIPVAPFDANLCDGSRNCIPQKGTNVKVDTLYNHTMFRLAYRNFGDHEALVTNESVDANSNDLSGIRWYEFRNATGGSPFVYQQGTYAPDANDRWMGSAAMDGSGDLAVGYSVSSSSIYPSIRYAGRLVTDPLGQLAQGEASLIEGTGAQTSGNRWGDYSDMTVDPTDDCTFWYTQEYYQTNGGNWHTHIGAFKFPSCGQVVPTPTGTPPTATTTPTVTETATPEPTPCAVYTDTTSTGTLVPGTTDLGVNCDDCAVPITLPFPVQLYGQSYTNGYVSSNGNIQFGGSSSFAFGNACLPVPIFAVAVAPYWDDLAEQTAGLGVFTSVSGSAPNRIFNVEWRALDFQNNQNVDFEARLYEGSNQVDFVYGPTMVDAGSATIGIQHGTTAFTQFACDTAAALPNLVVSFTAPACATPTAVPPTNTPVATDTAVPTDTPKATETPTMVPTTPAPSATTTTVPPSVTATPTIGPVCNASFTDVNPGDYFYTPVIYLACHGIISGYGDHTFRPYNFTTRGQMVKIVVGGFQIPIVQPQGGQYTFADVPPANPFFIAIESAAASNIVSGYACGSSAAEPCDILHRPYFRPNTYVTRGQLTKITVVAAGWAILNPPTATFADVPSASPFYPYIETAVCHGIISGYADGTFRPANNTIRGQIAKIVYGALTFGQAACTSATSTPIR